MTTTIGKAAGARAERVRGTAAIATRLNALASPTTHVLHNVPVGLGANVIDHLIVGPQGVFSVSIRQHPGHNVLVDGYAMHVDGEYVTWLRAAKFQAERVATLLRTQARIDVPVRACVVLVTGFTSPSVTFRTRPIGASVLTKRDVPKWFRGQPTVLSQSEVTQIVWVARATGIGSKTGE